MERVSHCLGVGYIMAGLRSEGFMESLSGLVIGDLPSPSRHRARNVGTQGVILSTVPSFPVVARGQNEL